MTVAVAIGADDAGLDLKDRLAAMLRDAGVEVTDYGAHPGDGTDYPDVALTVAKAIARGEHARAILICGTGIGMAIAANKVPGVYAAQVHDAYSAERARKSNNAQVMTLGRARRRPRAGGVTRADLARLRVPGRRLGPQGGQDRGGRSSAQRDHGLGIEP